MNNSGVSNTVFSSIAALYHRVCEKLRRRTVLRAAYRGNYSPLLQEAEAALNTTLWSFGAEHPETARKLAAFAAVLDMSGAVEEAVPLLRRAIAVFTLGGETTQKELFGVIEQLAEMQRTAGKMHESAEIYSDLISRQEAAVGTRSHAEIARLIDELALVNKALGQTTKAKNLHREALLIWETLRGSGSSEVARCLTHLASLYLDEHQYAEAEPLLLRAVDAWRRSPNPHDLYAIITLSCCGNLYRNTGRADEARGVELEAKAVLARYAKG